MNIPKQFDVKSLVEKDPRYAKLMSQLKDDEQKAIKETIEKLSSSLFTIGTKLTDITNKAASDIKSRKTVPSQDIAKK